MLALYFQTELYSASWEVRMCESCGNPIIPNVGMADSHVRVYNNRMYNFATQDYSPNSSRFIMKKWRLWSSEDLISWTLESELYPSVLGFPKDFQNCWATDSHYYNGKYYWYVCDPHNTFVVSADSPSGPWEAPIGDKPLMEGRDPSIFEDDDGTVYMITGVWNFKIAKLSDDMVSLKDTPVTLKIINPRGPYNKDGYNLRQPTDDKPFLHKYNNKYYLSWGCYYAISDNIYGPYIYKGCFIVPERTDDMFLQHEYGLTHDRHGSFFEWNNQTYFICNDLSSNGAHKYWRNSVISYVHYRNDGSIEPLYLSKLGVACYDARDNVIEAENYYSIKNASKYEINNGNFVVKLTNNNGELVFTNVRGLYDKTNLFLNILTSEDYINGTVELWSCRKDRMDNLLGIKEISSTKNKFINVKVPLNKALNETENLLLVFKSDSNKEIMIDYFFFY